MLSILSSEYILLFSLAVVVAADKVLKVGFHYDLYPVEFHVRYSLLHNKPALMR